MVDGKNFEMLLIWSYNIFDNNRRSKEPTNDYKEILSLDEDFCLKIECSDNEDKNGYEKCVYIFFNIYIYIFVTSC